MAIDIESPGGSEAELKAALRSLVGGFVPIPLVQPTYPVEYIDVPLSTDYAFFQLILTNFATDHVSGANVALAMSQDGGSTYLCDVANNDTYALTLGSPSSLLALTAAPCSPTVLVSHFCFLDPGSATAPFLITDWYAQSTDGSDPLITGLAGVMTGGSGGVGGPNPWAINPWPLGRCNIMRILPSLGNGDPCDPPTTGWSFTKGTVTLFGVPTT